MKYQIVDIGKVDGYCFLHNNLVGRIGTFNSSTRITGPDRWYGGSFLLDYPLKCQELNPARSFFFASVKVREVSE